MHSKSLVQRPFFFSAHNKAHFPTLYLISNLSLELGLMGSAWEPSEQDFSHTAILELKCLEKESVYKILKENFRERDHLGDPWVDGEIIWISGYKRQDWINVAQDLRQESDLVKTMLLAHAGSSLADSFTLKMEAIRSSETSVHTRTTRCHIAENGFLHSYRRPPKRLFTQELHGATSQKTAFFIVTAVKTSNLTRYWSFRFHRILEVAWVAEQLSGSQEGLWST
jgi:hypothetical protein